MLGRFVVERIIFGQIFIIDIPSAFQPITKHQTSIKCNNLISKKTIHDSATIGHHQKTKLTLYTYDKHMSRLV
jgi:hypothetical protein